MKKSLSATTQKRTISLPAEQSMFIDQMVTNGSYASASEVVRAGIRALKERDNVVEQWLKTEVVSVYDAMVDDPKRGRQLDKVFVDIRTQHAKKNKGNKKSA